MRQWRSMTWKKMSTTSATSANPTGLRRRGGAHSSVWLRGSGSLLRACGSGGQRSAQIKPWLPLSQMANDGLKWQVRGGWAVAPPVGGGVALRGPRGDAGEAVLRQGEGRVEGPGLEVDQREVVLAPHPQPPEEVPLGLGLRGAERRAGCPGLLEIPLFGNVFGEVRWIV